MIEASGVRRSCEIEVKRAARSRSVSASTRASVEPLGQRDALDRHRRLIAKRVEQAPLVGGQQRPRRFAVDADHADRAAAGAQRQEQPLAARQGVGAAPGGAVVLPGPARRRHVGGVELVLGRIAGGDLEALPVPDRHQQDSAHVQHRGDLKGRRPQQIVERADPGDLAAEGVKLGRRFGPRPRGHHLSAGRSGQIADDNRDDQKKEQRNDIFRVSDRERVKRWQKEEVVSEYAKDAGEQRR